MCGIIGYSGYDNAEDIIIDALHALEYRGYDSAGMTIFANDGLRTVKTDGRVDELKNKAHDLFLPLSHSGIGHTRWATHGKPSEANAHPHGSDTLMLVHNGIIENYKELKQELYESGEKFYSQTDTEVIAKILERNYIKTNDPIASIISTISRLKGSYALGIVFKNEPDTVFAVKKDSPLLIGIREKGNYIASDISAFIKHTRTYIRPNDENIIKITKDAVCVFDKNLNKIQNELHTATWSSNDTQKSGFNHFMLKEIFEEPDAIKKTLDYLTVDSLPDFSSADIEDAFFENIDKIRIIACGTAMHSGLIGKYYIEKYARINVSVETASEFRYSNPIIGKNELAVIISQSGETADSLACLRLIKKMNVPTLSIVNTAGSTIARESEQVIYTQAGPEIAVASTKAFSVQMTVMMLLALKSAEKILSKNDIKEKINVLYSCITKTLHDVLCDTENIRKAADVIKNHKDAFFIGRGIDYYLCKEASLKLKEISYIHSEAYAAGELKHGTISLIEENTPVIAIATDTSLSEKIRSNIEEVKSRGAFIISICEKDNNAIKSVSDICLTIPKDDDFARSVTAAAVIQLLAYYTALSLGRDIDKPRNLAKSVTVE